MPLCHTAPALQSAKHDLDPIAAFVAALVVSDSCLELFAAWDARACPLVLQRFAGPIGNIAAVTQQLFDIWQTADQYPLINVAADPTGSDNQI